MGVCGLKKPGVFWLADIMNVMSSRSPLSVSHPNIASQWHPTLNESLTPGMVGSGSKQVVWWLGSCGHEWEAAVNSRVAGRGCHYCSGFKVLAGFNDLFTLFPPVAEQWDYVKNKNVDPLTLNGKSHKKVWWKCSIGHSWEQTVVNRVAQPDGCPVCVGVLFVSGANDFATTHPELAAEWHPTRNEGLLPSGVSAGSNRKVWWLGKCGHEWVMSVNARKSGQGCAVCAGKQVQTGVNDLATTHPVVAAEWHSTRNGGLLPVMVPGKSARKVWWQCDKGHEWEAKVYSRVNGNGCPVCANKVKSYNGVRGTVLLVDKCPELKDEWDEGLNSVSLGSVRYGSKKSYWWRCGLGHSWEASALSRSGGSGCPVCVNKKVLVGFNDLATTHPDVAAQWHPTRNGDVVPSGFTYGYNHKVWWLGECGHEWEATVLGRAGGYGCPSCPTVVSSGEQELYNYIESLGFKVVQSNRSVLGKHELDIYVPGKQVAVEFNGLYWHSEKFKKPKYHYDKWKACREAGVQLVQVWEDDYTRNPELVKRMLAYKLGVADFGRVYARETVVDVVSSGVAKSFLTVNHLQGYRSAKYYGLFTKGDDPVLVAVLGVAGKGETGLEVIRFATSKQVVGGFSKLLKHVLKEHPKVKKIVSYSHNDHSDGGVYERNGFRLEHSGKPGYSYWKSGWVARQNRLKFSPSSVRKNPDMVFVEGATERELAELNGLVRVYDSGSSLWVKEV